MSATPLFRFVKVNPVLLMGDGRAEGAVSVWNKEEQGNEKELSLFCPLQEGKVPSKLSGMERSAAFISSLPPYWKGVWSSLVQLPVTEEPHLSMWNCNLYILNLI